MTGLPEVDVAVQEESRAFWEGLTRGEIVMAWCEECDDHLWPPKAVCTSCLRPVTGSRVLSGEGEVYSFVVVHRGEGVFADCDLYVLAYVTLDGGPTIVAKVVGSDPSAVEVGLRVRLLARDGSAEPGHVGAAFEPVPSTP